MRLADLHPRINGSVTDGQLIFNCPVCGGHVHSVLVHISAAPYHERPAVLPHGTIIKVWQASGTFPDALTLQPSINIVKRVAPAEPGQPEQWVTDCWHGWITNGEVT